MSTTTLTHPLAGAEARPSHRAAWLGFIVVIASAVMDLLDSTITQTAAPAIRRDLGGSYADLEWFSAAYTLAMSADPAARQPARRRLRPPARAARRNRGLRRRLGAVRAAAPTRRR